MEKSTSCGAENRRTKYAHPTLREHLEDAAAVVVQQHHDDTRSKLSALGRNLGDFALERKSTQVMLQREIPSEERRLLEMLRDAKGGRHRAVNAVEPRLHSTASGLSPFT